MSGAGQEDKKPAEGGAHINLKVKGQGQGQVSSPADGNEVFSCAFKEAGCKKEKMSYTEKLEHEAYFCRHAPCACPISGCHYSSCHLYDHMLGHHLHNHILHGEATVTLHKSTELQLLVLLDASDSRVFLLVNRDDSQRYRWLQLLSVGPRPAAGHALGYSLEVHHAWPGSQSSGKVQCTRSWTGTERWGFEVPNSKWSSSDSLSATVRVRKIELAVGTSAPPASTKATAPDGPQGGERPARTKTKSRRVFGPDWVSK